MPDSANRKTPLHHLRASDIRGIAKLTTQAAAGVTRIAEGVHQSAVNAAGIPGDNAPGQTGGISGRVYKSIHDATQLVGKGVDTVLARLLPLSESDEDAKPGTPQREAVLAALNGVMGDRLAADNNPFAIPIPVSSCPCLKVWPAIPWPRLPQPGAPPWRTAWLATDWYPCTAHWANLW